MEEKQYEGKVKEVEDALNAIKLRQRKVVERKIANGEIKYSHQKKHFVYIDDEDKEFEIKKDPNEWDYDDEDDEDGDLNSDNEEEKKGEESNEAK